MARSLSANVTTGKSGGHDALYLLQVTVLEGSIYCFSYAEEFVDTYTYNANVLDKSKGLGRVGFKSRVEDGGGIATTDGWTFKIQNSALDSDIWGQITWEGAEVDLRLIFSDVAGASWANAAQLFNGYIEDVSWDWNIMEFKCISSAKTRHQDIPTLRFRKDVTPYTRMPDEINGKIIPLVWGDFAIDPIHKAAIGCDISSWAAANGHRDYIKGYLIDNQNDDALVVCFAAHQLYWTSQPEIDSTARLASKYNGMAPGSFGLSQLTEGSEDTAYGGDNIYVRKDCEVEQGSPMIARIIPIPYAGRDADASYCTDEDNTNSTDVEDTDVPPNEDYLYYVPVSWLSGIETGSLWQVRCAIQASGITNDEIDFQFEQLKSNGIPNGAFTENRTFGAAECTEDTMELITLGKGDAAWAISDDCARIRIRVSYVDNSAESGHFYLKNLYMQIYNVPDDPPNEFFGTVQGRKYDFLTGRVDHPDSNTDVIENPAGIIESIMRDILGLATADIDTGAFDDVATELDGWIFARQILNPEDSLKMIRQICYESGSVYYHDYANQESMFRLEPVSSIDTIALADIALDSNKKPMISVGFTPLKKLYSEFWLHYKRNAATGEYDEVLYVKNPSAGSASGNHNLASDGATYWGYCNDVYTDLGVSAVWEYEADWIRDAATAELFLEFMIRWLTFRRAVVKCTTYLDFINLELGDQIKVDCPILLDAWNDSDYFLVTAQTIEPLTSRIHFELLNIGTP